MLIMQQDINPLWNDKTLIKKPTYNDNQWPRMYVLSMHIDSNAGNENHVPRWKSYEDEQAGRILSMPCIGMYKSE